jgi:murein DD-endopeptidase MepM/ murein hydrolase activator NlpD
LFLRQPLQVGRQTSNFGMRLHPILHKMKAHFGVDFAANVGTPVYAAGDGHLVSAERAGAAGNVVRVRHDGGYLTEYMHLQRFATSVKPGDVVHKGQVVGFVGSTGLSTGPHLHFGVKHNSKYLDPASLGGVVQPAVGSRERNAFEAESKTLLDLLSALGKGLGDGV